MVSVGTLVMGTDINRKKNIKEFQRHICSGLEKGAFPLKRAKSRGLALRKYGQLSWTSQAKHWRRVASGICPNFRHDLLILAS